MGADAKQSRAITWFTYCGIAFAVGLVVFQALNPAMGPASETTGTVLGSAFVPADGPPPSKNVWVRVSDGDVAVINTRTDLPLSPGQEVRLHVYRRLLTNTKLYAIADSEAVK